MFTLTSSLVSRFTRRFCKMAYIWLGFVNALGWCLCVSGTMFLGHWVCHHSYGTTLTSTPAVDSEIVCAADCAMKEMCKSAIFSPDTGDCLTNTDTSLYIGDTSTCSHLVKYMAVRKRSCATIADCSSVINSECTDTVCQCINGYSLSPAEGICTPNCTTYGSTFTEYPGYSLGGFNDDYLFDATFDECMQACAEETSFVCRTVDYNVDVSCQLSSETAYTQPDALEYEAGWIMAHRNCA